VRNPKTEQPVSADDSKAHVMTFADKGVIPKFAAPQKIIFVEALGESLMSDSPLQGGLAS
jgi:hypothetical protein